MNELFTGTTSRCCFGSWPSQGQSVKFWQMGLNGWSEYEWMT
jgi:hypothetical protein